MERIRGLWKAHRNPVELRRRRFGLFLFMNDRCATLLPTKCFGRLHHMIYLDYNATTPVLPEVRESMLPFFCELWGNPSNPYPFAKKAADAIEEARAHIALLIGAQPEEIVFTSCATESNQTILYGTGGEIAASTVEHSSINKFLKRRETAHSIPVDSSGRLDLEALNYILGKLQIKLVSVIWANNETGVISPVEEIAELCKKYGVLFLSDAVQAAGKIEIDVEQVGIDYLSISAHKIYGPKGIGALYVREGSSYKPLLVGSQERGLRGGTESVPLIVGFGKAAELAKKNLTTRADHTREIRNLLEQRVLQEIPCAMINGDTKYRLPNTTNIGLRGIDSEILVQLMGNQGIMISNGSACKSSAITPSHVLQSMGKSHEEASEAVRFSVSHLTTEQDIDAMLEALKTVVASLQTMG